MSYPFPSWLPKPIRECYQLSNINGLFEWQIEILSNKSLFSPDSCNLIYSAPTSAGKTLVSELLACHQLLSTRKRVLFIFPYISTAREKLVQVQNLLRSIGLIGKGYIGNMSSSLYGWAAAVCTIEKANSLINSFIESGNLDEIGTIVVDEIHMLLDGERGSNLENLLVKLRYFSLHAGRSIQIIGMSATLPQANLLVEWLDTKFYTTDFRPIRLNEYRLHDTTVFDLKTTNEHRKLPAEFVMKSDNSRVIGLTIEALAEEKAVLIFCPTKAEVENTALSIAKYIKYCIDKGGSNRFYSICSQIHCAYGPNKLPDKKTQCFDKHLLKALQYGVSFHHAGLTIEEREEVEKLFRDGVLRILVSTSTLSSGVNLPANRVIIKAHSTAPIRLNPITYCQMVGRAGRQGQLISYEVITLAIKRIHAVLPDSQLLKLHNTNNHDVDLFNDLNATHTVNLIPRFLLENL